MLEVDFAEIYLHMSIGGEKLPWLPIVRRYGERHEQKLRLKHSLFETVPSQFSDREWLLTVKISLPLHNLSGTVLALPGSPAIMCVARNTDKFSERIISSNLLKV